MGRLPLRHHPSRTVPAGLSEATSNMPITPRTRLGISSRQQSHDEPSPSLPHLVKRPFLRASHTSSPLIVVPLLLGPQATIAFSPHTSQSVMLAARPSCRRTSPIPCSTISTVCPPHVTIHPPHHSPPLAVETPPWRYPHAVLARSYVELVSQRRGCAGWSTGRMLSAALAGRPRRLSRTSPPDCVGSEVCGGSSSIAPAVLT